MLPPGLPGGFACASPLAVSMQLIPPSCPTHVFLLQGDATYLVVTDSGIQDYGINSICTHLGCVVPWNGVSAGGWRGGALGVGESACQVRHARMLVSAGKAAAAHLQTVSGR